MPVLPLQIRLDERHVAGIDGFCTVQDPRTGLHVTLSRQQVILMMIDDFLTRHAQPPPVAAAPVPDPPPLPSPLLGEQEQHLKAPTPASLPMETPTPATSTPVEPKEKWKPIIEWFRQHQNAPALPAEITAGVGMSTNAVSSHLRYMLQHHALECAEVVDGKKAYRLTAAYAAASQG